MPDIQLTDNERKVLSYMSRGVSKDLAIDKISKFFAMTPNDTAGAINSLRKQNLVIESKGVGAGVTVYTTSPLKVKSSMLDPQVIELLKQGEAGGKAAGFKRKQYVTDAETGEVMEAEHAEKRAAARKKTPDLGFDLEE